MNKKIKEIFDKAEDLHPYKKKGDRDSHSKYNEAWSGAVDFLRTEFDELQKELVIIEREEIEGFKEIERIITLENTTLSIKATHLARYWVFDWLLNYNKERE